MIRKAVNDMRFSWYFRECASGSSGIFDFLPRIYADWHVGKRAVGVGWGCWFIELEVWK
jgi:hypothetical protein